MVISSLGVLIFIFIIIAVFSSVITSVEVFTSTQELYKILCFILLYFLVVNIVQKFKQAEILILVIVITGFIVSVYGIFQFFRAYQPSNPPRITSTFPPNPNSLAGYLVLISPVALGLSLSNKKWWFPAIISFATMFFALLFTYSRGGVLSFIIALALFYLLTRRIKKVFPSRALSSRLIVVLGLLVVITIIFVGLNLQVGNTLLIREGSSITASSGEGQDYFISDRLKIWQGALKIIRGAPLLGVGLGNFERAFQRYKFPRENVFPARYNLTANFAHNEFLQLGAEMGIVVLGLVVAMLIIFFRKGIQGFRSKETGDSSISENFQSGYNLSPFIRAGILSAVAGIIVHSLVDFPLRPPATAITFTFWGSLIMATANPPVKLRISGFPAYRKWLAVAVVVILFLGLGWSITAPSWASFYRDRGYACAEKEKWEEAITNYRKAIRLTPGNPDYHYELAVIYRQTAIATIKEDLIISARWELEKAVRLSPREAVYHYHLGRIYWEEFLRGDKEFLSEAIAEFEEAIAVNPTFVFAYNALGMVYAERREYHRAGEYFQKALDWEPYYAETRYHLGEIYFAQGYREKAIREWETVLAIGEKRSQSTLKTGYQKGLVDFNYSLAYSRIKELEREGENF